MSKESYLSLFHYYIDYEQIIITTRFSIYCGYVLIVLFKHVYDNDPIKRHPELLLYRHERTYHSGLVVFCSGSQNKRWLETRDSILNDIQDNVATKWIPERYSDILDSILKFNCMLFRLISNRVCKKSRTSHQIYGKDSWIWRNSFKLMFKNTNKFFFIL